jgi:hypothetical protein
LAFDNNPQRLNFNTGCAFRRKGDGVNEERVGCAPTKRLKSASGLGAKRRNLEFELDRPLAAVLDPTTPDPF